MSTKSKKLSIKILIEQFLFSFILLLILLHVAPTYADETKWQEVPSTESGKQWWNQKKLRLDKDGNLVIETIFIPKKQTTTYLYSMKINCQLEQFKDYQELILYLVNIYIRLTDGAINDYSKNRSEESKFLVYKLKNEIIKYLDYAGKRVNNFRRYNQFLTSNFLILSSHT